MTGESTWRQPDALGVSTPDGSSRYWIVDGQPTWQPPAEFAWRAVPSKDHAGREYFENWVTKASVWERPAALGWSRRSYNNTYWWNVVTGETQREAPVHVVGFEAPSGHKYYVDPSTQEVGAGPAGRAALPWPAERGVLTPVAAPLAGHLGGARRRRVARGARALRDAARARARGMRAALTQLPRARQSEQHDRAYWFNKITQERVWTRPAESNVAWVRYHEEL